MSPAAGPLRGRLEERPVFDVLQELHLTGASGVLEVDGSEHKRRLFLRQGSLFLAATHPLARRLGELVAALSDPSDPDAAATRKRCFELVERMAKVIAEWRSGHFQFDEDPSARGVDLVGPLPTRRLLMLGATVGATAERIVSRWGGEATQLVATRPAEGGDGEGRPSDLLGFEPEEQFLLERLRQPMTIAALLAESPFDRDSTCLRLAQLFAARAIQVPERSESAAPAAPPHDAALLQSLSNRFARDLKEEPLRLPLDEFRSQVAALLAGIGALNHYELLGVDSSSTADEVQSRYERLARQVHPANETAYGLTGMKPMLELLFERATQAYLVLSDAERRRKYNLAQAIDLEAEKVTGVAREVESKELARSYFDQAQGLIARGDFHYAVELLQLAAKLDRKSEYLLALARVEIKNPKWVDRARDRCRAALETDPHNAEIRYLLGEIYEQAGEIDRARAQYAAAVREDPGHIQAGAKIRNLAPGRSARTESDSGSLLGRLFGRREG